MLHVLQNMSNPHRKCKVTPSKNGERKQINMAFSDNTQTWQQIRQFLLMTTSVITFETLPRM